jgi:ABC-type nitrate/sulfonate/bicarbonate transport system substrate-binding protein
MPSNYLVVPVGSSIKSFADLKGRKLGILGGSIQWQTIAEYLLSQEGLSANEVMLVGLTPALQVQALASRQIDALLALEPVATIAQEQKIGKIAVSGAAEQSISDPFYAGAGAVNAQFLKNNPKLASRVIAIISSSTNEINADPDAARQYLEKYTSVNEAVASAVSLGTFKMYDDVAPQDFDAVKKLFDIFASYGVINGTLDLHSFLYSPQP